MIGRIVDRGKSNTIRKEERKDAFQVENSVLLIRKEERERQGMYEGGSSA